MVWSSQTHEEEPLTELSTGPKISYEWSPDGKGLLVSQAPSASERMQVWLLNLADAPHAEISAQKIVSDSVYGLYQAHYSSDGRWIVLEAFKSAGPVSRLYVTPASGGPLTEITDGTYWADKPRWSPDGKTIYFVSGRSGAFNVWGIGFDPSSGKPRGEVFPVTSFESPGPTVPRQIPDVELSLTQDKLVLTMEELSGSIWVLDNVGP